MTGFTTPMMKQYIQIKQKYPDYLLLYRLGDFYELFLEDAEVGARTLQITLTRRPRGRDGDIPMAGVPYHAVDRYITRLIKAGHKVAICEQVSEPDNKGIVEREVVRLITSGTVLDEQALEQKEHNFIMALHTGPKTIGIAAADISTGDFFVSQVDKKTDLSHELLRFKPAECLLNENDYNNPEVLKCLKDVCSCNITRFTEWDLHTSKAEENLQKHFNVATLRGFGIEGKSQAVTSAAALLGYITQTQMGKVHHMRTLKVYEPTENVLLDSSTVFNLELFATIHEGKREGSLISVIDQTCTPMGGRLLREWLRQPLRDKGRIEKRLKRVDALLHHHRLRGTLREIMHDLYDVERILARLSARIGHAGDVINLASSLQMCLRIKSMILNEHNPELDSLVHAISHDLQKLVTHIQACIVDMPPIDTKGGGIFREGVHAELDELRGIMHGAKSWVKTLEQQEKETTGITTLKVRFNKVFGYYIEISKSFLDKVPGHYLRKQTLVNAERFITPELKEYEEKILTAEEQTQKLEYELFCALVREVLTYTAAIQQASAKIASLDVLSTFAECADLYHYTKPTVNNSGVIHITDGRHPVVERLLDERAFVPNSTELNQQSNQLHIITGPNMAGKSVYMRQVALITLLAHIGSFVPARTAEISLVDRIFVRSGASDMITSGLSTFMVEMVETARILLYTTPKSLIVLDEIGRGTSTFDGISIAWAVTEYLITRWKKGPKTLFATHYHELQQLAKLHPEHVSNHHMAIEEHHDVPVFLYKLISNGASHSYGIAVAQLAGVPEEVIRTAKQVLQKLENKERMRHHQDPVLEKIMCLRLEKMTPVEAMQFLSQIQQEHIT